MNKRIAALLTAALLFLPSCGTSDGGKVQLTPIRQAAEEAASFIPGEY